MRIGSVIALLIFIAAALLVLAQLWFTPLSAAMFIKLLITLSVLFVITVATSLVIREFGSYKHMKDNDYID